MYIAYFDEVKAMPQHGQDHYLVGGIAVPMDKIGQLEKEVTKLALEVFESEELSKETEFHASYCYFSKSNFRGMAMEMRASILIRLAQILCSVEGVKKVYAAINTPKLYNSAQAPEIAFAHFVERMERAIPSGSSCLLIGDLDDQQATNMVADFSRFRQRGTPWQYGIDINKVVDSVHFCRSHHSRLLQLADVYMFLVSGNYGNRKGPMAEALAAARKDSGIDLFPDRYKEWPKG